MSRNRKIMVTIALVLSNAMAGLDGTIINTALPAIISDFHGIQYMGWIVAIFLLAMAVTTPLWSKFGERHGNKKAYILAIFIFTIGALLQGLAPNMICFILARGLMGIGAGGVNTIPFIVYAQIFDSLERRAQVIGVAAASFSGASIMGPLLGGWIVDQFSWHWVFYVNIPIAIISMLIMYFCFNLKEKLNQAKVDYRGIVLMILGIVAILIGIQELGIAPIWLTIILIAIGSVLLLRMVAVEDKVEDPIIPNRLYKNRQLMIDMAFFALMWGAFVAFNIYVPMWAQGILGLSALVGGMTQVPGSIANFFGSELGTIFQKKMGRYNIIAVGTIAFLIAFTGLFFAGKNASYTLLLFLGTFEGFAVGLSFNILQVCVQYDAEPRDVPVATSFAYLVRIIAQTFMSSIYSVILNHSLMKGVQGSHGQITMSMLNQLSNSHAAKNLPQDLLPQMRTILYNGIHNIMLTALVLIVIVTILLLNIYRLNSVKSKATQTI